MILSEGDRKFIRTKLMPFFNIEGLNIEYSPSKVKYPDIWVTLGKVPVITVTDEWRRQKAGARRSRLTHEALHIKGLQHGKIGKYNFNTKPELDTYSKKVYKDIVRIMG